VIDDSDPVSGQGFFLFSDFVLELSALLFFVSCTSGVMLI